VWALSMERFSNRQRKFNEEAQMLSYVYYKLGYEAKTANPFIKRMWTHLYGAHNAGPEDLSLTVWHLPIEKKLGLSRLFADVARSRSAFWLSGDGESYVSYLSRKLGIPRRSGIKYLLDAHSLFRQKLFGTYR